MKIATLVPLLLAAAAVGNVLPPAVEPDASPHAEAIRLVMEKRADEIRALEAAIDGKEDAWWFDTLDRSWTAKRPVGPGMLDTTHFFSVTYSIDGKVVGTWSVNTRFDVVGRPGESVRID